MERRAKFPGSLPLLLFLSLWLLAACAASSQRLPERTDLGEGRAEFVGWLAESGEFRLYGNVENMRAGNRQGCVSGAFPLAGFQAIKDRYVGHKVRIIGRAVDWSGNPPEVLALIHEGSHIINNCLQDYVIFAEDIAIVD